MYFQEKIPSILYNNNLLKDITVNYRIKNLIQSNQYQEYISGDNETPDLISYKFYDSFQYHYIIMMANEKYDIYNDYAVSDDILNERLSSIPLKTLYFTNGVYKSNKQLNNSFTPFTNHDQIKEKNNKNRYLIIPDRRILKYV
jgi:hypothetical protein